MEALMFNKESIDIVCYSSRDVWRQYCKKNAITFRPFPAYCCGNRYAQYVLRRHIANPMASDWVGYLLNQKVTKDNLDVCIFPMPTTLAAQISIPTITAIHDLMYRYEPSAVDVGDPDRSWYDALYQTILEGASVVLVDSTTGEAHVRESFEGIAADIAVLPFCVPPYVPKQEDGRYLDGNYILSRISLQVRQVSKQPYLFYPAAHRRQKNHVNLIAALKILADEGLVIPLVLSGPSGQETDALLALIDESGLSSHIRMLPYVNNDELCFLYRQARALIMPTFYGPTNIPPLEAFALGCPVVVSDIYGMAEQVEGAALLVDPYNSRAIADAIKRIWTDDHLCMDLVAKGYKRSKKLSQRNFSATLGDVVRGMMDHR
jgi:glycosyltransferase involved in cell wall biosynthesis